MLIDQRHRSSLLDVRTFRGANVDSDHFLVVLKLRHKINKSFHKRREQKTKKLDVEQLKKTEISSNYKKELRNRIPSNEEIAPIENAWQDLKQIIDEASRKAIPEYQAKKRNEWFDEECRIITEKKNQAYKIMVQKHYTRHAEEKYKELRREEKRTHRRKKQTYLDGLYTEIENLKTQKESRKFYQLVNNIRGEFNPRTIACKNENGEMIRDTEDVLIRWREHFKTLLKGTDNEKETVMNNSMPTINDAEEEHNPPTPYEIELAVKKLNNNKSSGPDGIKAELMKINETKLNKALHDIICTIWTQEQMPTEWEEGSVCPIYKKGDKLECCNYRGITLLNTAYKIFSNILYNRLSSYTAKIIGNYQCGFQRGKTTTDQIHSIRQILERTKEYNIDTYHLFIDFKAAYDSVNREELLAAMVEFNIPKKIINLVRMTLKNVKCRIKVMSQLSEPFYTEQGLRQGDSLSCLLFNLALEKAVRDSELNTSGTVLQRTVQLLAFADDIDIIGRTKRAVVEAFVRLESAAKKMGLAINEDKTKFMIATNKTIDMSPLRIDNYTFETVKQFKYLGTIISSNNDIMIELKNRIYMANRCFYGLRSQLKSKLINIKTKTNLYKTLIRPVALYGCECWTLKKSEEKLLLTFERKILRKIFGAIKQNDVWRIAYNHELYKKFGEPDIVKIAKTSRIRWLGHLYRYEDISPTKKVTFSTIDGKRRKGRPPTRWLDSVENDLKVLGVNRWRAMALDRRRWKGLGETALACKRL